MRKILDKAENRGTFLADLPGRVAGYNAMDWYLISAQLGDGWAQFELGLIYSQLATRNIAKAMYWFNKAISCGDQRVRRCAERELERLKKETY